jgi:hypothetical protein
MELETAKEIPSEIFYSRPMNVEEMEQIRLEGKNTINLFYAAMLRGPKRLADSSHRETPPGLLNSNPLQLS